MEIACFSKNYFVKRIMREDVESVLKLCESNPLYFEYCPPMATEESVLEDMEALPPNVQKENKYYVGYFEEEKLVAILDLIDGYPKDKIAFIGLFMVNADCQEKGIGSAIIQELLQNLKENSIKSVRLAWVKGNPQAEHFWVKNGFVVVKETESFGDAHHVVLAELCLSNVLR